MPARTLRRITLKSPAGDTALSALRRCYRKLPEEDRLFLRLHYAEGRKLLPPERMRIVRLRRKLKACVEDALCRLRAGADDLPDELCTFLSATVDEPWSPERDKLYAKRPETADLCAQQLDMDCLLRQFHAAPRGKLRLSLPLGLAATLAATLALASAKLMREKSLSPETLQTNPVSQALTANEESEMNATNAIIAAAATALSANADVFSDASLWIKFDKDYDNSGVVSANSVRDVRDCSTAAAFSARTYGANGGPLLQETQVYMPLRNETAAKKVAEFPVSRQTTSGGNVALFPATVSLPSMPMPKYQTVLARVFVDRTPADELGNANPWNYGAYLYNGGLDWENAKGFEVGIQTINVTDKFSPCACVGKTFMQWWGGAVSGNTFQKLIGGSGLPVTNWYDLAWSFRPKEDGTGDELLFAWANKFTGGLKSVVMDIGTTLVESGNTAYTPLIGAEKVVENYSYNTSGNYMKHFHGLVDMLAVWNRPLTLEEMEDAFTRPRRMFEIGLENGSGSEFGVVAETPAVYNIDDPFHEMPRALTAARPKLSLAWNARKEYAGLSQVLRLKPVSGVATVSLKVNGVACGSRSFSGGEKQYFVPANTIAEGENTFELELVSGEELLFDKLALLGSWQIGYADSSDDEMGLEVKTEELFTYKEGVPDFTKVRRDIVGHSEKYRAARVAFFADDSVFSGHAFAYQTKIVRLGGNKDDLAGYTGEDGIVRLPLQISLNGTQVFDGRVANLQELDVPLPEELLENGWNEFLFYFSESTAKGSWYSFDYHRLAIKDSPKGTVVMLLGD